PIAPLVEVVSLAVIGGSASATPSGCERSVSGPAIVAVGATLPLAVGPKERTLAFPKSLTYIVVSYATARSSIDCAAMVVSGPEMLLVGATFPFAPGGKTFRLP